VINKKIFGLIIDKAFNELELNSSRYLVHSNSKPVTLSIALKISTKE